MNDASVPATAGRVSGTDTVGVVPDEIVVLLDKRRTAAPYAVGDTILQTARMAGLNAPSSCETGSCATCMARITEGSARMLNNDALDEDDVNDGWVLTCQALPTSRTLRVEYE
jgi:ferredoxin